MVKVGWGHAFLAVLVGTLVWWWKMSEQKTVTVQSTGCLGSVLAVGYFYIIYAVLTGQVFK